MWSESFGQNVFTGTTAPDGDRMGSLVVAFTTAVQPGDNHRVAATLKESAMDLLSER